jgi:hypothetical protein
MEETLKVLTAALAEYHALAEKLAHALLDSRAELENKTQLHTAMLADHSTELQRLADSIRGNITTYSDLVMAPLDKAKANDQADPAATNVL